MPSQRRSSLPAKRMEARHDTVLLHEAVEGLLIAPGDVVVDGTIGGAGHLALMHEKLGPEGTLIGIDADEEAIARAKEKIGGREGARLVLANDNFRNLGKILDEAGVARIDRALFDLGWSGFHLSSGRGFSFKKDEPLLMTYGTDLEGETAASILNSASEEELSDILYMYGEERFARSIARAIVRARKEAPILMTDDLVRVVEEATPSWYQHRKLHPATKTFQALRIAVNDELDALREGLATAVERLTNKGRIAVITFHSIEDRIVKSLFRDAAYAGKGSLVNRKPIVPSEEETKRNPRARSAKLRIFSATPKDSSVLTASIMAPAALSYL